MAIRTPRSRTREAAAKLLSSLGLHGCRRLGLSTSAFHERSRPRDETTQRNTGAATPSPCRQMLANRADCWNGTARRGRGARARRQRRGEPGVRRASRVQFCRQYRQNWPAVARRTSGRLGAVNSMQTPRSGQFKIAYASSGAGAVIPYARIFRQSVVRPMPRSSAARERMPPVCASAASIAARSSSAPDDAL